MIYYVGIVLVLLAALDRLRRSRIENKMLEARYRLFEMRDMLRELILQDKVSADNWVFRYLDTSITRTIDKLHTLSVWTALVLWLRYRNDAKVSAASEALEHAICQPRNAQLHTIYQLYTGLLVLHLLDRHRFLYGLVTLATSIASALGMLVESIIFQLGRAQTLAPATSTLLEFRTA